jgi:predicted metal-dependent hydrolase
MGHHGGMPEVIEFAGHCVEVRRRPFQRRLSVTVHPSGVIRVSANKSLRPSAIRQFLQENKNWLEKSIKGSLDLRQKHPPKKFVSGEFYPYLGESYRLRLSKGAPQRVVVEPGEIQFFIPRDEAELTPRQRQRYYNSFRASYKQVAARIMAQRVELYSGRMQLVPSGLQFRGQKTVWGSCSPTNKISLNYKLIIAPLPIVDYVVIHELAHIKHKNHSKNFWNLVEQYTPHRHWARQWLRENTFSADFLNKTSELHG